VEDILTETRLARLLADSDAVGCRTRDCFSPSPISFLSFPDLFLPSCFLPDSDRHCTFEIAS